MSPQGYSGGLPHAPVTRYGRRHFTEAKPTMSPTFSRAVAAAMDGHTAQSWHGLPQSERAALIYAEMRKIDVESVKRWLVTEGERRAA